MAYSTPAMVRLALVPSGDGGLPNPPSNTAADLSDAQLVDAIAEADALINGYLAKWYVVPVAGTTAPVNYWSRDIAAYNATLSYRGSMDFSDDDPVARRYRAVMEALKGVAKGDLRLDLPLSAGTGSTAASGAGPAINPYVGDLWRPSDFVGPADHGDAPLPYWRTP